MNSVYPLRTAWQINPTQILITFPTTYPPPYQPNPETSTARYQTAERFRLMEGIIYNLRAENDALKEKLEAINPQHYIGE